MISERIYKVLFCTITEEILIAESDVLTGALKEQWLLLLTRLLSSFA